MVNVQVISNRLPVEIKKNISGGFNIRPSSGGLATGLLALSEHMSINWIGWPGNCNLNNQEKDGVGVILAKQKLFPIWLNSMDYEAYYKGFCNQILWPLFHYFPQIPVYSEASWESYKRVNQLFCDFIVSNYKPKDVIWIHDYHLMLLPKFLREKIPDAKIGFFLHIPFPHYEIFRQLPWAKEILESLGRSDIIGFHTQSYCDYFLEAVKMILKANKETKGFSYQGRKVMVDKFPIGIGYKNFSQLKNKEEVSKLAKSIKSKYINQKIILSVDRLDYTKGIVNRLLAFEQFLKTYPEYKTKIALLELIVPSRAEVAEYSSLKKEIDELSGRINGQYGTPFWTPVKYFYRNLNLSSLVALYRVADIALVTPLRDGMNLVAKEFIASQGKDPGVLILSKLAGAAEQLDQAILINPHNINEMVHAIKEALEMDTIEKQLRVEVMKRCVKKYDILFWAREFLSSLEMCSSKKENPLVVQ